MRNFTTRNSAPSLPIRVCRNSAGPLLVSRIAAATPSSSGLSSSSPHPAPTQVDPPLQHARAAGERRLVHVQQRQAADRAYRDARVRPRRSRPVPPRGRRRSPRGSTRADAPGRAPRPTTRPPPRCPHHVDAPRRGSPRSRPAPAGPPASHRRCPPAGRRPPARSRRTARGPAAPASAVAAAWSPTTTTR